MSEHDDVTRPSHYVIKDGVEVIDVREWWLARMEESEVIDLPDAHQAGGLATISHLERAMEYLLRAPGKSGMQDVRKAYQYLHRAIHGDWPGGDERVDEIVRERDRLREAMELILDDHRTADDAHGDRREEWVDTIRNVLERTGAA